MTAVSFTGGTLIACGTLAFVAFMVGVLAGAFWSAPLEPEWMQEPTCPPAPAVQADSAHCQRAIQTGHAAARSTLTQGGLQ